MERLLSDVDQKKNVNIELLRCIACYFVIIIHTWGTFRMEGGSFHPEVFVGGVVARCAVPIFFMITGYVYSNKKELLYKYKNFIYRILLPVLLMTFFTAVVLARGIHFFLDESQEYVSLGMYLKMILTGNMSNTYLSFHFWYVEELITFYLLLPILQFVLDNTDKACKIRRFYLVIGGIAYFLIPLIEKITGWENINICMPEGLFVIWYILFGFELAQHKLQKIGNIGILCHWACIIAMSLLEYFFEYVATGDIHHGFSSNQSLFILGSAAGLFVFIITRKIPERWHKGICSVGKSTLGIYIVHVVVYSVLYQVNITKLMDYVPVLMFCIIYSTVIFLVSYVGIKILDILLNMVKKITKREKCNV